MSKQDRQGARTPAQLEQEYQFGRSFAEAMGLAMEAKNEAAEAKKATAELNKSLNHEEIFNRLTNNGKVEGIYRDENGDVYVNASFLKGGEIDASVVKVINLVAEVVKSILGNCEMRIDGAALRLFQNGAQLAAISVEYDNYASLRLDQTNFGHTALEAGGDVVQFTDYSGNIPKAVASLGVENGEGVLTTDRINGIEVQWKDNGNGTLNLIGINPAQQRENEITTRIDLGNVGATNSNWQTLTIPHAIGGINKVVKCDGYITGPRATALPAINGGLVMVWADRTNVYLYRETAYTPPPDERLCVDLTYTR